LPVEVAEAEGVDAGTVVGGADDGDGAADLPLVDERLHPPRDEAEFVPVEVGRPRRADAGQEHTENERTNGSHEERLHKGCQGCQPMSSSRTVPAVTASRVLTTRSAPAARNLSSG